MQIHLLFVFGLLLNSASVKGFSNQVVEETSGGIIQDLLTVEERARIDREQYHDADFSHTNYTNGDNSFRINCFSKNLTFMLNGNSFSPECNLTYHISSPMALSIDTDLYNTATIDPYWLYISPTTEPITIPFVINIKPLLMGKVYLKMWVRAAKPKTIDFAQYFWDRNNDSLVQQYEQALHINDTGSVYTDSSVMGISVIILRNRGMLEVVFRVVVAVLEVAITFVMGCQLDGQLILKHLKNPIGPTIGFICQFGIMPLIAFAIAMVIPIKPELGFGLLVTGCCPGGCGSNIWTLLLNGDLNLSMTMTFISSIAALGMMPLLLFIYGRFFLDVNQIQIPYPNISSHILYVALPVLFGLLVKWLLPSIGHQITRAFRPLAFIYIAILIGFDTYVILDVYKLMAEYSLILPTAAALPWIGFFLAGHFAYICCLPWSEIVTTAIETGIQNILNATLVLLYSMAQPDGDIVSVMPLLVSVFTPLPLMLAYIAVRVYKGECRCCSYCHCPDIRLRRQHLEILGSKEDIQVNIKYSMGPNEQIMTKPIQIP